MIRKFLTAFSLIFFTQQVICQTLCDLTNHYDDFVLVQKHAHNENFFLSKQIVKTHENSCFSELVNQNLEYLNYLLTNFSSKSNNSDHLKLSDSLMIRSAFLTDLKKDSLFNALMSELASKTINQSTPKDTINIDVLLNLSVKYFSITHVNDQGNYVVRVCSGLNDIKKTESERRPLIEAFCFASVFKHFIGKEFDISEEFYNHVKQLYKVNLGLDKNEKLLRAQGAIFMLMRNNEVLKQLLLAEYERHQAFLPFILAEQ